MHELTQMVGFVVATNFDSAKTFYGNKLGFRLVSEDEYGMTFDAHGCKLRVTRAESFTPAQGTVLGWSVTDMHETIRALVANGVHFEQFNLSFMPQDPDGVWTAPSGDEIAWFKDPEGNVLSISKHRIG
jgi:catechol 2,3-dioxygenase-like lactoylglutathione lyase family enzyme